MSEAENYYTIEKAAIAEFTDRGSRFIAFAYPVQTAEECRRLLLQLKKEHTKAAHYCFAYRLGMNGRLFRVSDDREPAGTAGKSILGRIDSKRLSNVVIIVIRYFGGTLLGVPGLIHAYRSVAAMVLQLVPVVEKPVEIMYELQFDYTLMNEVMHIVKQCNCSVAGREVQLFCLLQVGIPKARLEEVLYRFNGLHNITAKKVAKPDA